MSRERAQISLSLHTQRLQSQPGKQTAAEYFQRRWRSPSLRGVLRHSEGPRQHQYKGRLPVPWAPSHSPWFCKPDLPCPAEHGAAASEPRSDSASVTRPQSTLPDTRGPNPPTNPQRPGVEEGSENEVTQAGHVTPHTPLFVTALVTSLIEAGWAACWRCDGADNNLESSRKVQGLTDEGTSA